MQLLSESPGSELQEPAFLILNIADGWHDIHRMTSCLVVSVVSSHLGQPHEEVDALMRHWAVFGNEVLFSFVDAWIWLSEVLHFCTLDFMPPLGLII